jgi:integrase
VGEPLYPDTVSGLMTKLINQHNKSVTSPAKQLPHARLHDLRHLHATTLLLAGVPPCTSSPPAWATPIPP